MIVNFIIAAPVAASAIVYYLAFKLSGKRQTALHRTMDGTTIFYVIAVNTLIFLIFGRVFYSWTAVFLLVIFSLIIVIQWKIETEVEIGRAFKALWRFSFLFFLLLYCFLMLVGLLQQLFFR